MRSLAGSRLGLFFLLVLLPSSALAQDAPEAVACFPECRPGFACQAGSCVSLCSEACAPNELCSPAGSCVSRCNPTCESGLVCGEDGLCQPAAPAGGVAAEPALPPPPPAATTPQPSGGAPVQPRYYVPEGYDSGPARVAGVEAVAPPPAVAAPVDPERARKQALRDQWRPTLTAGFGYTGRVIARDAFDYPIYSQGWGVNIGYGWRYHFARFGSFQTRGILTLGRYYGDYDRFYLDQEGMQVAVTGQATLRFVAYPFFVGGGAALGFMSMVDVGTDLSAGGVFEIGFHFGRDEQFEINTQGMFTSGIVSAWFLFSISYGDASEPAP